LGGDIQLEYYTLSTVINNTFWDSQIHTNLNAMLSITIMPPIYSILLNLSPVWILKIIYSFLLSLVPLALFLMYKNFCSEKISFLAAFFFISFPSFFFEIVGLSRQELAEFFIVISLLLIFNKSDDFSFKFYIIVIFIAFILLTVAGTFILAHSITNINLLSAWIMYSFTGAFLLLVSLLSAVLKGFNKVALVQKIVFITSFGSVISTWTALSFGFGLWALVVGGAVNITLSIWLFFSSSSKLWKQIIYSKVKYRYNWLKETLPLQWRYAISWTSGYLILQFMVPVTMYYAGAVLAGKLGLSLVIARAVQSMASSWGMTKLPEFNMLVAKRDRRKLDDLINKVQKQSLLVFILGAIAILLSLMFIFPLIGWEERILPVYEVGIILLAETALLIIYNWAFYLRSHKREPYMVLSVINGISTGVGVWASLYFFTSTLFALSVYCIVQWIILIPAGWIFIRKREEYSKMNI